MAAIEEIEGNFQEGVTATEHVIEEGLEKLEQDTRPFKEKGVFYRQPLKSIKNNGFNFLGNYRGDGGLFIVEPYIWFLLGVIISIVVAAKSDGENISSELSWIWIIFGIFIVIVSAKGKHRAEG